MEQETYIEEIDFIFINNLKDAKNKISPVSLLSKSIDAKRSDDLIELRWILGVKVGHQQLCLLPRLRLESRVLIVHGSEEPWEQFFHIRKKDIIVRRVKLDEAIGHRLVLCLVCFDWETSHEDGKHLVEGQGRG